MVHLSSSVLHILKSPSNLNRVRCYKVHYIALATLRTEKFKISNAYSYLQGESQVYVFHLLVKVRFLPFYEHRLFELYLVFSSCRIQDLEAVQCSGCLSRLWTLQMSKNVRRPVGKWVLTHSCGEMSVGFPNTTSITTCTRNFINHTGAKPLRDSIFYIKEILDFESSKDKPYISIGLHNWLPSLQNTSLCRDWEMPNIRDVKML